MYKKQLLKLIINFDWRVGTHTIEKGNCKKNINKHTSRIFQYIGGYKTLYNIHTLYINNFMGRSGFVLAVTRL